MNRPKVLLIGWDAADWEHIQPLLDQGLLPHLNGLIERGVMGNLATLHPVLSPMLWNSVATGKHAYKHRILGFIEPDPHHGGARPFSSCSRKTKALWNIFSQNGIRSNVINWWASHPAEKIDGCVITNLFNGIQRDGRGGYRAAAGVIHPAEKSEFYSQFKVFPHELTEEHLCAFVPRAAEIDQDQDSRLEVLARVIAETATTQAIGTTVLECEPWDFMAIYFTGIDHFSHAFMPYHPPRMPNIPEKDFEIFKDVVNGAYRFHDMILGRLLDLAGPETTTIVCSDHGFQSGALRPVNMPREPAGPAIWHRRFGIFVAAGPGIKQDERIYGASLIDIAPTILAMYGLPLGQDMDGRVLTEIFESPPHWEMIPSWDSMPGRSGMHESETALNNEDAAELMNQFMALGYIDDPGVDREDQAEAADIEVKYNLARNYTWLKMHDEAIPLMEEIVRRSPWENRFIIELVENYDQANYRRQALRVLEAAFDLPKSREPVVLFLWAKLLAGSGQQDAAVEILERLLTARMTQPGLLNRIGGLYLHLRKLDRAEQAFQSMLAIQPENAEALVGLSMIYRHRRDNERTADAALAAVGLIYRLPQAHFNLGVALARSGDYERATTAFETALKFGPRLVNAHRWLARLQRLVFHNTQQADYHVRQVRKLLSELATERDDRRERSTQLFDIPSFPDEQTRIQRIREERPLRRDPRKSSGKTFVLVSGLPRSGTSLMMQMLEAGGLSAKTDQLRSADVDNPKGYYEWEEIKRIARKPELLDEPGLENKVIKIVSPLLEKLPYNHNYRIIFMTRPIEEVAQSQTAMIHHRETTGASLGPAELQDELAQHRQSILRWLDNHPRMEFLEIDYPTLIQDPAPQIKGLAEFLGDRLTTPEKMSAVIDQQLYRQRSRRN